MAIPRYHHDDDDHSCADDTVSMYHELRQKAQESVYMQFELPDNIIAGAGTVYRQSDHYQRGGENISLGYMFKINGKTHNDTVQLQQSQFRGISDYYGYDMEKAVFKEMFDAIGRQVAEIVMRDVFTYGRRDPHGEFGGAPMPSIEERMDDQERYHRPNKY